MTKVLDETRQAVSSRANQICEYGRFPEHLSNVTFSVDHIVPGSKGGTNSIDNLAWSCLQCNNHKRAAVQHADPETGLDVPLFNPRLQNWLDHFGWKNNYTEVIGNTPTGRATIKRLKLNRIGLVSLRKLLVETDCHPDAPDYIVNWSTR